MLDSENALHKAWLDGGADEATIPTLELITMGMKFDRAVGEGLGYVAAAREFYRVDSPLAIATYETD